MSKFREIAHGVQLQGFRVDNANNFNEVSENHLFSIICNKMLGIYGSLPLVKTAKGWCRDRYERL